jgi:hypothetical protein
MTKLLTLLLTPAAAFGLARAQCSPNAVLCGGTILDVQQCKFKSFRPHLFLI